MSIRDLEVMIVRGPIDFATNKFKAQVRLLRGVEVVGIVDFDEYVDFELKGGDQEPTISLTPGQYTITDIQ